jgi:DNA polymerase I
VNRVVLARRAEGAVVARELADDGTTVGETRLPAGELTAFVRERERAPVRWVWDDTTRWYPALLGSGVRVERCTDLRLTHAVLRRSPLVDQTPFAVGETAAWDALQPVPPADPALFPLADPADGLDPVAEHERQQAALATSAHPAGLALLLAAESSGALVAAEMTHAGLPWRADVHERLLTGLLGPRPPHGRRPAVLEGLAREVRAALRAPELNPDSPGALLRALQTAGLAVEDTRSWTLEQLDHPVVGPLLEYKRLARLITANGWPGWRPGCARAGSGRGSCPAAW